MTWHLNSDGFHTRHAQPPAGAGVSYYGIAALSEGRLRRSLAVHEAGHAVLAFAFGIPVVEICLSADLGAGPGSGPAAWVQWGSSWSIPFARYFAMCAAGERSQDRWMREEGLWTPERAWVVERTAGTDRQKVAESLQERGMSLYYGHTPASGMDYATVTDAADAALCHLWDRVLSVAAALDEHGRLTGWQAARYARLTHVAVECDDEPFSVTAVEERCRGAEAASRKAASVREAA
ncbi:hypothetical protein [Streptomyces hiroshimensis]|uniref:Peptidase M41 domain-containing protein n=1 Tax=Streptomyces hiroshimensis TaxID=66424 RepID=A0ABQ2YI20_9ACTN|nr:hypothetical protein [Streptomyces hiroshimensis]GGX82567.1 hypothetical protein GCM10010324_30240 [Streptomyces hiroshimensis]